ncbi:hypothetical protein [Chryseobacterium luteum]|uniref:hypothetical protein n=1 Tax=Chryseobacterium luteum TaxID=421531 RepID=UPI000A973643|nr:hypothetical protein [Chryseobacterium luteum]
MKKNNRFNSVANNVFYVKTILLLLFFGFAVSASAYPVKIKKDDAENKTSKSLPDSISQHSDHGTTKIYISGGTVFYNVHELKGNIEFIQKEKPAKSEIVKISKRIRKTVKRNRVKLKTEEKKYTANARFITLSSKSDDYISGSNGKIITISTTNPKPRIELLKVEYHSYVYILAQEKCISRYMPSFTHEITHWEMHIRPPPVIYQFI